MSPAGGLSRRKVRCRTRGRGNVTHCRVSLTDSRLPGPDDLRRMLEAAGGGLPAPWRSVTEGRHTLTSRREGLDSHRPGSGYCPAPAVVRVPLQIPLSVPNRSRCRVTTHSSGAGSLVWDAHPAGSPLPRVRVCARQLLGRTGRGLRVPRGFGQGVGGTCLAQEEKERRWMSRPHPSALRELPACST
jgi:hypothetical protein